MKLSPSIYLEYGADEATCDDREFEICENGMSFQARWQFDEGTAFRVAFSYIEEGGNARRISAEGLVVDCEQKCPHCYTVTMLFLNLSDELRLAIRDVSGRLEASLDEAQNVMSRKVGD